MIITTHIHERDKSKGNMSKIEIEEDNDEKVIVNLQGIPYRFDDRTKIWTVWGIAEYFQMIQAKIQPLQSSEFANIRPLLKHFNREATRIVIKNVFKINPACYFQNFIDASNLQATIKLEEIGDSSLTFSETLIDSNNKEVLVERLLKETILDGTSRRQAKFPDWYIEKYSHIKGKGKYPSLSKVTIPRFPVDCFSQSVVLRQSDTDYNRHTNFTVYIKFCMDCATEAAINGYLIHYKEDMCKFPTETVKIDFIGESYAGDTLTTCMWQDGDDIQKFRFIILKGKKT